MAISASSPHHTVREIVVWGWVLSRFSSPRSADLLHLYPHSSSYCNGRSVLACGYTLCWTFQSPQVLKNVGCYNNTLILLACQFLLCTGSHPCAYKDSMLLFLKINTFPRAHSPFQTLFFLLLFLQTYSQVGSISFLSAFYISFSLTPIGLSIPPSHWKFSHFAQSIH